MEQKDMIKNLQDRFDLTSLQATVIYFTLEEHFKEKILSNPEIPNSKEVN